MPKQTGHQHNGLQAASGVVLAAQPAARNTSTRINLQQHPNQPQAASTRRISRRITNKHIQSAHAWLVVVVVVGIHVCTRGAPCQPQLQNSSRSRTQVSVRAPLPNTACQSIQLQTYMQGANTRREAATACCKQHLGQYTTQVLPWCWLQTPRLVTHTEIGAVKPPLHRSPCKYNNLTAAARQAQCALPAPPCSRRAALLMCH